MAVTEEGFLARKGTVLVLRALGLGDLLTGVPALRALRRCYPDHRIVLAAPHPLERLLPLVGGVDWLWPTPDLRSFTWPRAAPELAVNLHGRGPESTAAVRSTGAKRLMMHGGTPEDVGPQWIDEQHEIRKWCRLLEHYGVPADPDDLKLGYPSRGSDWPGSVVIHPGASHEARRWPAQRFAEVARWCMADGHQVVITGGRHEITLAEQVAAAAGLPRASVLAGGTDLWDLALLVAHAGLVVCGDTGLAHLASAFETPSVVLFGPVSPRRWGPPRRPWHVVLWRGTTGDTFADRPDPGLLDITSDQVIEAARPLLRRQVAATGGFR